MRISTMLVAALAGFSAAMPSSPVADVKAGLQARADTSHSTLGNGEWLLSGNSLFSQDGSVEFKMQVDGKIVIYWGGLPQWQNTREQRNDVKGLLMQGDGNCVLYTKNGVPIWHSNTAGTGSDSVAAIRNDGVFYVYRANPVFNVGPKKK
ncbi:hypothetical protein NLG97_g2839 [Lecanicillium saksenae]|uniref:Uncharacterized protein n=1 Tax=Lecanicillium saksenae TaxID=468837 RepID=A0ACC1R357_9HYPO|nr:hypothetical protein NLG97_g2839 [Lecanicillium saksenae]